MKTLGRILIILAVFAIVMGITFVIVNASNSSDSASTSAFERGGEGRTRSEGEQPELAGGRPDFGREGPRGGGWIFGLFKHIAIIAVIVALIAMPKSLMRKKPAPAPAE